VKRARMQLSASRSASIAPAAQGPATEKPRFETFVDQYRDTAKASAPGFQADWAYLAVVGALVLFAVLALVGVISAPALAPGIAFVLAALVFGYVIFRPK
jgi:hypothetical protein